MGIDPASNITRVEPASSLPVSSFNETKRPSPPGEGLFV